MMQRSLLFSGLGLFVGMSAAIPVASIYLNHMAGLGLNGGSAFSFVTGFPGVAALGSGTWSTALRIIVGVGVLFSIAAFLLSLRQELTEYGQARFQKRADLKKAELLQDVGQGFVFAKLGKPGSKKPFVSALYDKFPHCLVVAPTRAGKGVGYVIPNTLLFPGSTVVLDVKGEIFEATARHRQSQGDRVFRYAPLDFEHPTHRYNPLERVARIENPERRYTELAKISDYFLTVSDKGSAGDFLTEGRELFVAAGLLAIERGRPTIGEISRILFGNGATQEEYKLRAEEVKHVSAARTFRKFSGYADRTLSSHASVLSGAGLSLWNNPAIDRATSANDFSFADLRKRPQSIYLVVNADDIRTVAPLIRLFFGELIATLRASLPDAKTEPWPVMVLLDEFDQLGPMPIVEQALKQLAGHGARVSIITQSIPGIDNIYGENIRLSLESAAGMKLFLSPNEKKTAAEVSDALGKTTKLAVSDSLSRDTGFRQKRSVSRRMEERPLMTPDEIRKLSADKVILVPERQNPILAERIVYFQDPTFRTLIEAQKGPLPFPSVERAEIATMREEIEGLRRAITTLSFGTDGASRTSSQVAEEAVADIGQDQGVSDAPVPDLPDDDLVGAFAGQIKPAMETFREQVERKFAGA
ncbi:MAG: type IV secretory system conjugative DNA transfer family protein [Albidovulum sp.]|uniref:type IV secretory system conjugative DNA transfer family protein n=1 Tax=Albidovulum sp. TaxID=1872424 RepID=UPI003CA89355